MPEFKKLSATEIQELSRAAATLLTLPSTWTHWRLSGQATGDRSPWVMATFKGPSRGGPALRQPVRARRFAGGGHRRRINWCFRSWRRTREPSSRIA